ncbi:MAG: GntR family transcriptional regulator [Rhizobiaceae bacterium]
MAFQLDELLNQENWNRKGGGPLYVQLREQLQQAIRSGQIGPGEALPSERDLAELSKVSRITVRKAVRDLANAGLLIQRQGSGTSVAPSSDRVEQSLSRLTSFSEDMARRGKVVHSQWLERGLYDPTIEETLALGLKPHSLVSRIVRLRFADDKPMAIERASLSPEHLPDPEAVGGSLYAHLDKTGCKPVRAIQRIRAVNLKPDHARLLQVEPGAAGLSIERTSYLASGQVLEFTQSQYLGDAYEFVADLEIPTTSK